MPMTRSLQVLIADADPPALLCLRTQLLTWGTRLLPSRQRAVMPSSSPGDTSPILW